MKRAVPVLRGAWGRSAVASWIAVILSGIAWFGAVAASIAGETSLLDVSPETFEIVLFTGDVEPSAC